MDGAGTRGEIQHSTRTTPTSSGGTPSSATTGGTPTDSVEGLERVGVEISDHGGRQSCIIGLYREQEDRYGGVEGVGVAYAAGGGGGALGSEASEG